MLDIVRCRIPVFGPGIIPFDNGYLLFSALCNLLPELHGADHLAVSPLEGAASTDRGLAVTDRAYFWIQSPIAELQYAYRLAGKQIRVGNQPLRLGMARPEIIRSSSSLFSRMVSVRNKLEADSLKSHIRMQLHHLNETHPGLEERDAVEGIHIDMLRRRIMTIAGRKVVGYGVRLDGLTERMSILVQQHSVSGRRRFGISFFIPVNR